MTFEEIPPGERTPGLTRLLISGRTFVCVGVGDAVRAALIEKYEYPERFIVSPDVEGVGADHYRPGDVIAPL